MKATNPSDGFPIDGKSDFGVAGISASNSDTEVDKSGSNNGKNYLTFAASGVSGEHYRPVETYEGIHRYDPDFSWEPAEEKRVVRKVCGHPRNFASRPLLTFVRLTNGFVPGCA